MRRITLWALATVTALVLLFSYRTSTMGASAPSSVAVGTDLSQGGSSTSSSGSSSGSSKTYEGSTAQTRWGPIQVTITVSDGKITSVDVPTYPDGNPRDIEINDNALPILKEETLSAQSADIDTVSGATVTSDGYIESLQAALDSANLS